MNRSPKATRYTLSTLAFAGAMLLSLTVLAGQEGDPTVADSGEGSYDIPGEYVVDFHDDVGLSAIRSLLAKLGAPTFKATALEPETRIELVQLAPGKAAGAMLAALRADPRVEYVEPHAKVRVLFDPNDPMYAEQWHLKRIESDGAWDFATGRGVTVAVIDTGIACENFKEFNKVTDLKQTRCVEGYNFVKRNAHANDDHGHGTHVAGTIAQSTNNGLGVAGLAHHANLMPVKVLSGSGWGSTTWVADGIRWAADNGAQVINLSLGSPRDSLVLRAAVRYAKSRGVVVVAAAGNSGGKVGYPGGTKGVIGVSATDSNDKLAWFSSRGKGVDIAAPGVSVLQQTICNKGRDGCEQFAAFNGTSMASPHVAAAAALLVSMGVTNPDAVEEILLENAKKIDDSDKAGDYYGAGLLQAESAVSDTLRAQVLARFVALFAMAVLAFRWSRKKGKRYSLATIRFWVPALLTSVGFLWFAPWLIGSRHELAFDLLTRPVGDWDLLIGVSLHKFLPLANVIVPLGLAALFLRVKGMAPVLSGFAVGTAAYLCATVALGHLATPFGWLLTTLWCVGNALACTYLGSLLLVKDRKG